MKPAPLALFLRIRRRACSTETAMNRATATTSRLADTFVIAAFGFCVCTATAFGQTTRPGKEEPKQEQPPPEDSPEPLPNARRQYEALFGGASTQKQGRSYLNFNGSVAEVYDEDEVPEGEPELGGLYTNFTGNLNYRRDASRATIAATGGLNLRYYTQLSEFLAADYYGSVGIESKVTSHTTMLVNQAVSYSPVTLPSLFANPLPPELGAPLPPGSNFAVTNNRLLTTATTAEVEHGFSVRAQFVARGSYRYNNSLEESTPGSDWSMLDSGAFYRYRVTRSRSLRAGYNYRRASYGFAETSAGPGPQPDEHNLFVGVTIDRDFSAENRTMLSFAGGTSVFNSVAPEALLQSGDRMRFTFEASVAQQIGKTWLFLGTYDRGSLFNQGYGGPVFGDAVSVSATGFFNARTDVTTFLAYSEGQTLLAVAGQSFNTSTGGARFRFALSRNWALMAEYFRYSYDFTTAPNFPFVIGVPERFSRNSIRGGVLVFLPILPR